MSPPRPGFIHPLANIGDPPESRDLTHCGLPPMIEPTAQINAFVTVDAGTTQSTYIGRNVFAMAHVHIGHDAIVADNCELSPHVIVGGWAVLHRNVRVGMGAIIRNRVKVGEGARIGMGAVVTKDVPAGETWVGNPAHNIERDPKIDPLWSEWFDSRG